VLRPRAAWTYGIARAARWPYPPLLLILAALLALVATSWRPPLWGAVAIWGFQAFVTTLDARLRGKGGLVAAAFSAIGGPIASTITSVARRRSVRKIEPGYRSVYPLAIAAAIVACVVAERVADVSLHRLAFSVRVRGVAMEPLLRKGDLVVVSPLTFGMPHRGELVALGDYAPARRQLGHRRERVIALLRIVGLPGETIGANARSEVYRCTTTPSTPDPIVDDDPSTTADDRTKGCQKIDETLYVRSRTAPFGPVQIPPSRVFLLADDRRQIVDSRLFGSVPQSEIAGTVVATVWPWRRLGLR
jgi:signal peptidase I